MRAQNITFIYRGKEYERLSEFTNRILCERPGAKRMDTTAPPSEAIMESNEMRILLCVCSSAVVLSENVKINKKLKALSTRTFQQRLTVLLA